LRGDEGGEACDAAIDARISSGDVWQCDISTGCLGGNATTLKHPTVNCQLPTLGFI
jgi:hypothetical protein